jgi:hypothetical protein
VSRRLFWTGVVVGWAVMAVGVIGLMGNDSGVPPVGVTRWMVGSALVHDLVVAPIVVGVGMVVARWVRPPYRAIVQGALLVSAMVTLVAWPFVRGYGRLANNPSILPNNYAAGLASVLAVVWGAAALALVWTRMRRSRARLSTDGE